MKLTDIVAVSGMPGLYKMIASRDNGMIIEDFETGKRQFVSVRNHQFTPLATVGIYTQKDVEELGTIFDTLRKGEVAIPDVNAPGPELHMFFRKVVPEYDEGQVSMGDIKKVVKWFGFLKEKNLFEWLDAAEKESEEKEKEEKAKKEEREQEEKRMKEEREKKAAEEKEKAEGARKEAAKRAPVAKEKKEKKQATKAAEAQKEKAVKAEGKKKEVASRKATPKKAASKKATPKKEVKPVSAKSKGTTKPVKPTTRKTVTANKKGK